MNILPFDLTMTISVDVIQFVVVTFLIVAFSWFFYMRKLDVKPEEITGLSFVSLTLWLWGFSMLIGLLISFIAKVILGVIIGLFIGFDNVFVVTQHASVPN